MKAVRSVRERVVRLPRVFLVLVVLAAAACSVFGSSLDHFTDGGSPAGCGSNLDKCGQACVDLGSDPNHCGSCGNACPSGQVCDLGSCSDSCSGGKTNCTGACVNLDTDPLHCGDCAVACNGGETCASGSCNVSCFPGQTECGGACVDLQSDDQHCGQCGNTCPLGQTCGAGACKVSCTTGQTECGGACVDTQTNQNHCGSCGNACGASEGCAGGQCKIACPGTQTECSGLCYDLLSDDKNCGSCGNVCANGEVCGNGQCTLNCPTGQDNCSGSCVDLQTNAANCGSCGNACGTNEECAAGKCVTACKTLLNGTAIDDKAGYFWDGLERAAADFDTAKTTCEGVGGRLPTASELYRVSATQSATVGQTSNTNYLWSLAPYGTANQVRVRLSDAATSTVTKGTNLNYRCVCPPPLPTAYVGGNCFGPSGAPCYGLDADNKKTNLDASDRPPLPKAAAIWECSFYRGHLARPDRLIEAVKKGIGTGSNVWLHTADDVRSDRDLLVRWQDPTAFATDTGTNHGVTTNVRPFRCTGASYDAGTHPVTLTDEFVGPNGGNKGEKADSASSAWAAAISACWGRGGHVATATELAELVFAGLPAGSNSWLWAGDESYTVSSAPTVEAFRWPAISTPTYASGTDLNGVAKTSSHPYRCVYYPVDTNYAGPAGSVCSGGCKELALPGTSGAKVWFDQNDRAPAVTLDAAIDACRAAGGRLPTGRDLVEAVRAGLDNGSNAWVWSADFALFQSTPLTALQLRAHLARWTGSVPTFDDSWSTYSSASLLTSNRAYRCMWTNEIR